MAIDKVWVLAEVGDSGPTPVTLELLTEARAVASTVEAVAWGADAASLAGPLGEYGATTLYDVGDLGGALPGVPVAAALAALIEGGNAPDAILIPGHLRRPRHRRPAVGQARPPGADQRDRAGRVRRRAVEPAPGLRRQPDRHGALHRRGAGHLRHPGQVVRGRAVGRCRRGGRAGPGPRRGRHQHGQGRRAPRRGAQRPQARRGGGRRLGRPRPGRRGQLRPDRGAGQAPPRRRRRQPRHRRRRLGALLAPGGPDRQDGQADRLHRVRDLGRHPAPGRA